MSVYSVEILLSLTIEYVWDCYRAFRNVGGDNDLKWGTEWMSMVVVEGVLAGVMVVVEGVVAGVMVVMFSILVSTSGGVSGDKS